MVNSMNLPHFGKLSVSTSIYSITLQNLSITHFDELSVSGISVCHISVKFSVAHFHTHSVAGLSNYLCLSTKSLYASAIPSLNPVLCLHPKLCSLLQSNNFLGVPSGLDES